MIQRPSRSTLFPYTMLFRSLYSYRFKFFRPAYSRTGPAGQESQPVNNCRTDSLGKWGKNFRYLGGLGPDFSRHNIKNSSLATDSNFFRLSFQPDRKVNR